MSPLLTAPLCERLLASARQPSKLECSLDLGRTTTLVDVDAAGWSWRDRRYPHVVKAKERTIYFWEGSQFAPVQRFEGSLIKLVPTEWGPPTFEIDGIKMLPSAKVSPYEDAKQKVSLIQPRGKRVLDCCGGLGYFAGWCIEGEVGSILSFEKNPTVAWLRSLNPWSPGPDARLTLKIADVTAEIAGIPSGSMDAVLHDPPRFGIAGELYSGAFYAELARVLKPGGLLFHYTGSPNKLTSGRDVPREIMTRLQSAGFAARLQGDGVLARKKP